MCVCVEDPVKIYPSMDVAVAWHGIDRRPQAHEFAAVLEICFDAETFLLDAETCGDGSGGKNGQGYWRLGFISQMLYVWNISLHDWVMFGVNVGKYISAPRILWV